MPCKDPAFVGCKKVGLSRLPPRLLLSNFLFDTTSFQTLSTFLQCHQAVGSLNSVFTF